MSQTNRQDNRKKPWLVFVKIGATLVAFYLAFNMIDLNKVKSVLGHIDILLLAVALVLYAGSQAVSSERLKLFINKLRTGKMVSSNWNGLLYMVGMAYNLFLPGGIGGDGYKLYAYQKKLNAPTKRVFGALLLDRLSGLLAIGMLLAVLPYLNEAAFTHWYGLFWAVPIGLLVVVSYQLVGKRFRRYKEIFAPVLSLAVLVQILQVGAILILVNAVGLHEHEVGLAAVFLISSVATAIPAFLGGLGAREVVFAALAGTFSYDSTTAVAAALLFSFITVVTALPGLFLSFRKLS